MIEICQNRERNIVYCVVLQVSSKATHRTLQM